MDPIVNIFTISNDLRQYGMMRESFEAAGFDRNNCVFTLLDNTTGNVHEPYSAISAALMVCEQPYFIFCHQDIRVNGGQLASDLIIKIKELDRNHPNWMLAGNAGFDFGGKAVVHLDDPTASTRSPDLPKAVLSLDENFLVLRSKSGLRATSVLQGFHMYGTDLCLNSYKIGGSCYVIDFLVTHLSSGSPNSPEYRSALLRFTAEWRKELALGVIRTTCTQIYLSHSPIVENLMLRFGALTECMWYRRKPLVFLDGSYRSIKTWMYVARLSVLALVWKLGWYFHMSRGLFGPRQAA